MITDYAKIGQKYGDISRVISVSILYFNLGTGDDYIYYANTEFYGAHTNEKLKLRRKEKAYFEYYLIDVEAFNDVVEEDIDEWIYMLKNADIKTEFKAKYIKEAG